MIVRICEANVFIEIIFAKEENLYYRDFFYSLMEDPKIHLHLKYQYSLDEKVFNIYDGLSILRPK